LFIVVDSLLDDRFKSNPLVLGGPFIRFYAGMPLVTRTGYNIGTLCIIDTKPRSLSENQKFVLRTLAKQVITNFELRKKDKELHVLNENTQRLTKAKEEFFSNMSHELRTPLNAISGFSENLYKTKLDPEQKEQLGIIRSSVDILISLVNDILDYSKIDSGSLVIEKHTFNLRSMIKATFELLKIKAQEKNLSFILNVGTELPTYVKGDKIRLNQILINLIGNAIKFTKKGFVTLSIDSVADSAEKLDLRVSVKDTGIGIPADKLEEIFHRFQQVEGTTRVFGGSGFGLSISKSLVEMQNGKLDVTSEFGKGSEFSFSIKYQKSSKEEILLFEDGERASEPISKLNLKNIRVLLAEDNVINVKVIKKLFEGTGILLEAVEDGKVCIEKLKQKSFDVILMDLYMPEMDGYEATRYIRNTLNLKVPIIAFSANICETDRKKSLEVGMNEYITKPFKIEELLRTIYRFSHSINWKTLWEYTGNDGDFEKEMIEMFLIEMPKYLKDLEIVIEKEEFCAIKGAAHKIKSPLGIFGLEELKSNFVKIEELSAKLQIIPIVKIFADSQICLERILSDLEVVRKQMN